MWYVNEELYLYQLQQYFQFYQLQVLFCIKISFLLSYRRNVYLYDLGELGFLVFFEVYFKWYFLEIVKVFGCSRVGEKL